MSIQADVNTVHEWQPLTRNGSAVAARVYRGSRFDVRVACDTERETRIVTAIIDALTYALLGAKASLDFDARDAEVGAR